MRVLQFAREITDLKAKLEKSNRQFAVQATVLEVPADMLGAFTSHAATQL